MVLYALGGLLRPVDELVADIDSSAGDLPVAMAAGKALLVEVEVVGVAGIAGVSGPDLQAGAGIAGKDGGGDVFVVGSVDVVGLVDAALWLVRDLFELGIARQAALRAAIGRGEAVGVFDEMGVDEEEVEAGFGDGLLDADAVGDGWNACGVGGGDGLGPEAGGAIAALGNPDATGMRAEMADMGRDGGANLGADALVGAEQRQVAVGGGAGDDLDQSGVVEAAEAADDVAVEGVEVIERGGEEAAPEAGSFGEVSVAGLDEEGLVLARGDDFAGKVFGEFGEEVGVGELFEQDGREVDVEVCGDAVALEVGEDAKQREVGLCGGFVQPLDAVRPGAVVDDVRQMRVQGEGEKAGWSCPLPSSKRPQLQR